jgi:hypothetical protein
MRMIILSSDCSSCSSKSPYTVPSRFSRFGSVTTESSALGAEGALPCNRPGCRPKRCKTELVHGP